MTILPSLAPWLWGALAAVPVGIVLLYFLKLRRQPVTVPSTFLWAKTIEDLHVNSLLQRLRSTPLLLLQLFAVAMAALALLRPGFRDESRSDSKRIFLLDASASMQATDGEEGLSRFNQAKQMIAAEIDAMSDQDVAMLMTVSDRTDVMQSFTSDRRKLRESLTAATVTNRTTSIQSALRAADGLARGPRGDGSEDDPQTNESEPQTELLLYSDGGFTTQTDVDTSRLNPRYVRVGSASVSNLSIVAFSAQRSESDPNVVEAFATIANLGTTPLSSPVSLRMNGELIDADEIKLEPGEESGVAFQLANEAIVRLSLSLDERDGLLIDNIAYATLAPQRTVPVLLVSPGNTALELALSTGAVERMCVLEVVAPSYFSSDLYKARAATGSDGLIVYDRCKPDSMPQTNTFFIGAIPPVGWNWSVSNPQVLLVDIDRSHPIMRYLDLFSLLIAEGRTLTPPAGATNLLAAETGPILSIAPRVGFEDLVLGFDIISSTANGGSAFNTDWQVQRSWPVFVFNVVRYLTGAVDGSGAASHRPGELVTLSTDRRQGELSIRSPGGAIEFVKPDLTGRLSYAGGEAIGIYEVEDEKRVIDLFTVNLFDRRESTLASADTVQLGYTEVSDAQMTTASRREYWRFLLSGMLGVLTVEWWFYARRIG